MKWNEWLVSDIKKILIFEGEISKWLGGKHEGKVVMKSASLELHKIYALHFVMEVKFNTHF